MTFELNIPATIAVVAVLLGFFLFWLEREFFGCLCLIVAMVSTITYCEGRPEKVAERKAEAEAARRAAIPHVIREADGCKVYAFTAGGQNHYFTRCGTTVTTERSYTVPVKCGKNCTRNEPRKEVIVTEENK